MDAPLARPALKRGDRVRVWHAGIEVEGTVKGFMWQDWADEATVLIALDSDTDGTPSLRVEQDRIVAVIEG